MHTDKAVATEKAKAVVAGAVSRVIENVPLEEIKVPINPNTLVVGGGIAGIQAALEIANAGFHVYLVEREPSIGGHMAQFDKTFPTLDCSACILTPRMVEAGTHPNITLLTWSDVVNVAGYVGNFHVTIKKKARFINEELCTGCGICQEKCPKKVIDEVFEAGLGVSQGGVHTIRTSCAELPRDGQGELHLLHQRAPARPVKNSARPARSISSRRMR